MLLHGVVTTKLEEIWVYNIRGLKILALGCFGLAFIMAISAGLAFMKFGMNGSFWFLVALASWGVVLGLYSLREKRRRAAVAGSGSWSRLRRFG